MQWPDGWTEQRLAELKELAALGLTNSQIAAKLGTTRSAISGKRSRLAGVPSHAKQPKYHIKRRDHQGVTEYDMAQNIRHKKAFLWAAPEVSIEPLKISLLDRKLTQCAWILDEKDDDNQALCCGHPTYEPSSYCPAHYRIVYLPSR